MSGKCKARECGPDDWDDYIMIIYMGQDFQRGCPGIITSLPSKPSTNHKAKSDVADLRMSSPKQPTADPFGSHRVVLRQAPISVLGDFERGRT